MLTRWYDIGREIAAIDELQRRLNKVFSSDYSRGLPTGIAGLAGSWPQANLYDTGSTLTAVVQVPGLREQDLQVEVHNDVLSISGERTPEAPEGYRVHRSERGARKFTRTFGLPCRVDAEQTTAKLTNGLLTVTMAKHPDSQPKQIAVAAS